MNGEFVQNLWSDFLDHVFPRDVHCAACDISLGEPYPYNLCPECSEAIQVVHGTVCRCCGRYIGPSAGADRCLHCLRDSVFLDGGVTYAHYQGGALELVHRLKYSKRPWLVHSMAEQMLPAVEQLVEREEIDTIIPVPVHPQRLTERGYNQAEQIGNHLSEWIGISMEPHGLIRQSDTLPQNQLSGSERIQNVRHAFVASEAVCLKGLRVLLIDDVLTTGSTINACARVLKANGVSQVFSAVYAAVAD